MSTQKPVCEFTVALFIIIKNWKQLKCPSTAEWMKTLGYLHTTECYSAMTRNEPRWLHATTWMNLKCILTQKVIHGSSLVAQWLRIRLPMQGTWVRALVWEDPTCPGATRPVSHNCWACASGARAPQQERPRWWEARAPRWRVAPACRN